MCGSAVTSITADPIASRVPGRQVGFAQIEIDEQLIAGEVPAALVLRHQRDDA